MPDALVSLLNKEGYQPMFLPRTGLLAPDVMLYFPENRKMVRYGRLSTLVPGVARLARSGGDVAPIEGKNTSGKDTAGTLGFLGRALRFFGIGSVPKIDMGFAGSEELIFAFRGVRANGVTLLQLRNFLSDIRLDGLPRDRVEAGDAHIAYEYLYARHLEIRRADRQEFKYDAKGKLDDILDLGVKGKITANGKLSITFEVQGDDLPAIAYKAGKLMPREAGGFDVLGERVQMTKNRTAPARSYVPFPGLVLDITDEENGETSPTPPSVA